MYSRTSLTNLLLFGQVLWYAVTAAPTNPTLLNSTKSYESYDEILARGLEEYGKTYPNTSFHFSIANAIFSHNQEQFTYLDIFGLDSDGLSGHWLMTINGGYEWWKDDERLPDYMAGLLSRPVDKIPGKPRLSCDDAVDRALQDGYEGPFTGVWFAIPVWAHTLGKEEYYYGLRPGLEYHGYAKLLFVGADTGTVIQGADAPWPTQEQVQTTLSASIPTATANLNLPPGEGLLRPGVNSAGGDGSITS